MTGFPGGDYNQRFAITVIRRARASGDVDSSDSWSAVLTEVCNE